MSAVFDSTEAVPIAKNEAREVVQTLPLVPHKPAIYVVPDDAVGVQLGCELAPLPLDREMQLVAFAYDSLDDGATWQLVTGLMYAGTGSKLRPNGQPHSDPQSSAHMRAGKGRLLKVVYASFLPISTSLAVRIF